MAEFSIIDTYFNRQKLSDDDLGVGDDSTLVTSFRSPIGDLCRYISCWSTFPSRYLTACDWWKSVAVNLSDIAAMGAQPHSILLALNTPN